MIALFCMSSAWGSDLSQIELKLLDQVNQERQSALLLNSKLNNVAQSVAEFAYASDFLTNTVQEGTVLSVDEAGYRAEKSGSATAIIIFSNYMDSDAAVGNLLNSMVRQMNTEDDLDIFSEDMLEIGICIFESRAQISGTWFNIYVGTAVWACPLIEEIETKTIESQVLNLINQYRASLSISPVLPVENNELQESISISFELENIASENVAKKIFDLISDDERLLATRFAGADVQVTTGIEVSEGRYVVKCRAEIAIDETPISGNHIIGLAYADNNLNNLYDPGEGLVNTPMVVYDAGVHSRTGIAGEINAQVTTGNKGYQIVLFVPGRGTIIHEANQSNQKFILININDEIY